MLEHDWSLFAPLEAVTQVFYNPCVNAPNRHTFLFAAIILLR